MKTKSMSSKADVVDRYLRYAGRKEYYYKQTGPEDGRDRKPQ